MSAMQVRKDVWERINPMLAQSRHQQMLMNVTPGKIERFVSSKLLTSYFCALHGSLCLCAISSTHHTHKHTPWHKYYTKDTWTSNLDWRCWHLHSHLHAIYSHNSVG